LVTLFSDHAEFAFQVRDLLGAQVESEVGLPQLLVLGVRFSYFLLNISLIVPAILENVLVL